VVPAGRALTDAYGDIGEVVAGEVGEFTLTRSGLRASSDSTTYGAGR